MSEAAMPSSESLPVEESHGLEPHIKVARARAGVLLLILSDVMMAASIMAAGGYLSALNTAGAFKGPGDQPLFPPGMVVALMLVLSGVCYFWWAQGMRRGAGTNAFFWLALVFILAALAAEIWVWLSLGYTTAPDEEPIYDAFRSVVIIVTAFATVHLLLTSILGVLMSGRLLRGRLAEQAYIVQSAGYWWYYTVISGVIIWLFIVLL
jgi:heme/copper-type cytochrome/quinol oxidase subunit 3